MPVAEKRKYGYIVFYDKKKLKNDGWDDEREPEIRKPSPAEREEIILNIVRDNSGKAIKVVRIAEALAVTERTIQKHLGNLERKGLIKRVKRCNKLHRQRANILKYTGPDTPRKASDITLEKLYDPDNPCGIRNWDWEEFKFIPGYYSSKDERKMIRSMGSMLLDMKKVNEEKKEQMRKADED
jgi:DNA-binding CsgD family transcriptional regulator